MSTRPDRPRRLPRSRATWAGRAGLARVGGITLIAMLGMFAVGFPMVISELDATPQPGRMRLLITLIAGVISLPFIIPALWWKRMIPAALNTYLPACAAALIVSLHSNEDYSFFYAGVPMVYGCGLLTFLLFPSLPVLSRRGTCHRCGYDLRATVEPRCPECGDAIDEAAQVTPRFRDVRMRGLIAITGLGVSATVQYFFLNGLLSLG